MLFLRHCFSTFLPLLIALFGLAGCAGKLKTMAVGSFVKDVAAATAKHDDIDLVAQAGPTFLLLIEGLLESNPDDQRLLLSAAELYTSYGALVELDDPERARSLYRRAKTYGLKALGQKKGLVPLLTSPYREFVQIRDHLKSKDVPLVFWTASSWGAWISVSIDSMGALADLPKVILLVVVPLILPISQAYDVHPIHLGIIFLTNLEIGYSTPPVGLNLFIASIRFDKPVLKLYWASLPFLLILLGILLLITYVPTLSLFLVDL